MIHPVRSTLLHVVFVKITFGSVSESSNTFVVVRWAQRDPEVMICDVIYSQYYIGNCKQQRGDGVVAYRYIRLSHCICLNSMWNYLALNTVTDFKLLNGRSFSDHHPQCLAGSTHIFTKMKDMMQPQHSVISLKHIILVSSLSLFRQISMPYPLML